MKDPVVAAVLAWLTPGLGHLYQGRTAKAILFFVCLMGTFVYGCYLGSSDKVGVARVVYFSWQEEDKRLSFFGQAGIGLTVLPALVQANLVNSGRDPLASGFMAPPLPENVNGDPKPETKKLPLNQINDGLRGYFELGSVYTMIAGLLNILVIYDAWGGPVFPAKKEEDEEEEGGQS